VSGNRYRVFHGFREEEVEHCTSDKCRCEMRGKIMMDE
jgi:hypothetical protein